MDFEGENGRRNFILAVCGGFLAVSILIFGIIAFVSNLVSPSPTPTKEQQTSAPEQQTPSTPSTPSSPSSPSGDDDEEEKKPAREISLDKETIELYEGDSYKFTVTVEPSDTTDTVIWSTDDEEIAIVENGVVQAISEGVTSINAIANNSVRTSAKVTVKKKPEQSPSNPSAPTPSEPSKPSQPTVVNPTGIKLDRSSETINIGASTRLNATVSPSNATNKTVTWSSSNTSVATVTSNGTVTGRAVGSTRITARTHNGKTASATITVKKAASANIPVTGVNITPTRVTVNVNASAKLTASVSPSNATSKTITWSSSNTSVATVSNGLVTGRKGGTATITARSNNGKTASAAITVVVPATGIKLSASSVNVTVGKSVFVSATVTPSSVSNPIVTWKSENTKIATVYGGTITGVSAGKTTVTATTHNGKVAKVTVTVVAGKKTAAITTSFDSVTLYDTGNQRNLNGKASDNLKVTYSSSNTKVATVNASGLITAKGAGTANITVKSASNSRYNAGTKTISITVPKIRDRVAALEPWRHTMIETYYFIYGREYRGGSPGTYSQTYDKAKVGTNKHLSKLSTGSNNKSQTCITLPTVSFKRQGLFGGKNVKSGNIWFGDGNNGSKPNAAVKSLKSYSKYVTVTYPHKSLKSLISSGGIHYGDIVARSGHTFVYMGTKANPKRIYQSGTSRTIGGGTKVNWGHYSNMTPKPKDSTAKNQIAATKKIMDNWRNGKIADSKFAGVDASGSNYSSNLHIVVSIKTFTVKTSCDNGSITHSNLYMANQNVKISYKPNSGKKLSFIEVDGKKVSGNTSSYTFSNINANHTIRVVYK